MIPMPNTATPAPVTSQNEGRTPSTAKVGRICTDASTITP